MLSLGLLATNLASLALSDAVVFSVTLTWAKGAPDGFERDMIFVNGQFPGPTLEINEGDNVEVSCMEIENNLETNILW